MSHEQWLRIPGWDKYEVSNLGLVRSLHRDEPKILAQHPEDAGHLRVTLFQDGRVLTERVHRLVALAFIGEPPVGTECCHFDGDPANNCVSNLRWDSRSANQLDRVRHGRHNESSKTHCPQGHPYDATNTMNSGDRRRRCLACHRARAQARRARQKTAA